MQYDDESLDPIEGEEDYQGIRGDQIDEAYDKKLNATSSGLSSAESSTEGGDKKIPQDKINGTAEGLGDKEASKNAATATPFKNNVSAKEDFSKVSTKGLRLKKKSAIISLVLALTGAASVPFLSTASLPFAIIANMNANSVGHSMQQYIEDYTGFRILDFKNKTSVQFSGEEMKGLTNDQIKELRARGVELDMADARVTKTGKTTFSKIKVNGTLIASQAELSAFIKKEPMALNKLLVTKPTLWKTAKNAATVGFSNTIKAVRNPKLTGDTIEEKNKSVIQDGTGGASGGSISTTEKAPNDKPSADAQSTANKTNSQLKDVQQTLQEDIKASQQAVSKGVQEIKPTEIQNMATSLGGVDPGKAIEVMDSKGMGLMGKVWSFVNVMSPLDLVCSIYNTANTAVTLAKGVIMVNAMRMALRFVAMVEKYKAGQGQDIGEMQYFMDILQKPSKSTGLAFDQSGMAQWLLTGNLPSEPPSISTVGGTGIKAMYSGLLAINTTLGGGNARAGAKNVREFCKVAQNVGLQVGVTVGTLVLGLFTGGGAFVGAGAAKAAGEAAEAGMKQGAIAIIKGVVTGFIKSIEKKVASHFSEGIVKTLAKDSWRAFKGTFKNLSFADKAGIALAGASTFAMPFIVEALTGGDILNALNDGFNFMEMIGVGFEDFDFATKLASGQSILSLPQVAQYENEIYKPAQQAYIATMQLQARGTPFDFNNPYSALGSALGSFRRVFGASGFMSVASTLTSIASLPSKLSSLVGGSAFADAKVTQADINAYVDNESYTEQNIAVRPGGSPLTGSIKGHSFEEVSDKLISTSADKPTATGHKPQILYEGNDENGEPKLSVIPGSNLDVYNKMCHNAERRETDPMYWDGDDAVSSTNAYPVKCMRPVTSGSSATLARAELVDNNTPLDPKNVEFNSLFDDATSYVNTVGADAPRTSGGTSGGGSVSLVDPSKWAVDKNSSGNIDKNSAEWKRWVADIGGNGNSSTGVLKPIPGSTPNICSQQNSLNQNGGGNLLNPNAAAAAAGLIKAFNGANAGRYLVPGACFRSIAGQDLAYGRSGGNKIGGEWDCQVTGKNTTGGAAACPGSSNHGWGLAIDYRVATSANDMGETITSFTSADYLWMKNNAYQYGWVNPIGMTPAGGCGSGQKCEPWHFQYVGPLYGN